MSEYKSPNATIMRKMHRIPDPAKVGDPSQDAPIYGTYPDAKMEGADYDVECAGWGDNEMPTNVTIVNGIGRKE